MTTSDDACHCGARHAADESGAMSILVGAIAIVAMLCATLAVDLGSHALAERDMQGAVDLAALDAVRGLGELSTGDPAGRATELAGLSLAGNDGWANRGGRTVTTTIGRFDADTRTFTPTGLAADAVLVEATTQFDRLLGFLPGADEVTHTAVAVTQGQASVSIGTSVASLDSDGVAVRNRVLARLLGRSTDLDLDLVGYRGLANGTVSVRRLAADLGLASPTELADTTVTVGQLFQAAATGLSSSGDPLSVAASMPMQTLATQAGSAGSIRIGDVLALERGTTGAVADVQVNALSLVGVTAQVVNGTNVVDLGLPVAIPGVGTGNLTLALLEPPQLAAGRAGVDPNTGTWRTVARTAQVRLGVDLRLDAVTAGPLAVSALDLPFVVEAGRGEAPLETVTCATATPEPSVVVPVATSGATVTLGLLPANLATASTPVPVQPADLATVRLGPLDLGVLQGSVQRDVGPTSQSLTFVGPYAEAQRTDGSNSLGGTPRVGGSGDDGRIGLAAALDTAQLGVPLAGATIDVDASVLGPVLTATTPVLDAVDRRVVGPLLESLGVALGRADVTVTDVDCDGRLLVR